ncbi:MAG TPA: hypothetical protein VF678_01455 [bacterium]
MAEATPEKTGATPPPAAAAPDAAAEPAKASEAVAGDAPADELAKLRPICTLAEENYQTILGLIKTIRESEGVLLRFHGRQDNVTPQDVEAAKGKFHDAKQSYLQLGNQINDGIKPVHALAKVYLEDLVVQNLYKTYLAKLLCSLETRHPVEPFVRRLADWVFVFDREEMTINEEEERRGLTLDRKRIEMQNSAQRAVIMLETRYQKRLLQNRLKAGEPPGKIARRVQALLGQDPEDLHTYIWIASLLSQELPKERNQNTRVGLRDDILTYCKKAFALIDDFLNLQGIQNLNERDKRRSEYVKTITAIRKPLVGKGA